MPILELTIEFGGRHTPQILVQCPPHQEGSPTPNVWNRFAKGRGVLSPDVKGERDAGAMKAMTCHHSSQVCLSFDPQGSVVGSVYTSSYHGDIIELLQLYNWQNWLMCLILRLHNQPVCSLFLLPVLSAPPPPLHESPLVFFQDDTALEGIIPYWYRKTMRSVS